MAVVEVKGEEAAVVKLPSTYNTIKKGMFLQQVVKDLVKDILRINIRKSLIGYSRSTFRNVSRRVLIELLELRITVLISSIQPYVLVRAARLEKAKSLPWHCFEWKAQNRPLSDVAVSPHRRRSDTLRALHWPS